MSSDRPAGWENRFDPPKMTLMIDKLMNYFIIVGGIAVIVAVMGIFVFILAEILPLFKGAEVKHAFDYTVPQADYVALGVDEWTELPMLIEKNGQPVFLDLAEGHAPLRPGVDFLSDHTVTAVFYNDGTEQIVYGTDSGACQITDVIYEPTFDDTGKRKITVTLKEGPSYELDDEGGRILQLAYGGSSERKMVVGLVENDGELHLKMITLKLKKTLFGKAKISVDQQVDLTDQVKGKVQKVLVSSNGEMVLVISEQGSVHYFQVDDEVELVQTFSPFAGKTTTAISSADFVFGDVSVNLIHEDGEHVIYSLYIPEGKQQRLFGKTKSFRDFAGGATMYVKSLRNKAFLIGNGNHVQLCYSTTESIRWQDKLDFEPRLAGMASKYNSILFLDDQNKLQVFTLHDPHPEAGFTAFFRDVWYEGYTHPDTVWQSTGATDEFEAKLSMIPLIIGTLKGTFYALLFAVPIAIFSAIYSSQFMKPWLKSIVKPIMEIMASLPSVVLGFLAALWFAPLFEARVPSIILFFVLAPGLAMIVGAILGRLPVRYKTWCPPGYEFFWFIPLLALICYLAWAGGPILEQTVFTVKDPTSGQMIGDFRLWWPEFTGTPFNQRNAMVVGFFMGFAVIPIIFTVSEDALSNVPRTLTSGSLALGASRWQTAVRVVLPTASAGIFSACMIGLGRAVGETMIVLMATGNTPVKELNIFSGMRTLSANIAVELPEAPHGGTLYRTLFLGAFMLFVMTFFVNTVAEMLRQHLRNKYKTV